MTSRIRRTLVLFRLALSYWGDSRRLAAARRQLSDDAFRAREAAIYRDGAIRFRTTALALGGLIIKVGQFLSARTDILPLAFTRELSALQDQVPPAPWPAVKALMEEEWGVPLDALFLHIDPDPIAAASLGQVHRGQLKDGQWVAVKVQRPEIQRLATIDLSALAIIMRVMERWTRVGRRLNATRLFREFQDLVHHELDYHREVQHLERFYKNFASDPQVRVPRPYPELTRSRVFVMEYMSGAKVTDSDALRAMGVEPAIIGDVLVRAYLKQIALDGFVQLDPHPGNFFVDQSGCVIFLDFGMMAEIPASDLQAVVALTEGVLRKDAGLVVQALSDLGFIRPVASPRLVKRAVAFMLERLAGTPLKPGPALDRAVSEFQDFLYHEPLEFPARYMFLGRAIGMLFGLVSQLNPQLDWMSFLQREALPLIQRRQRDEWPAWVQQVGDWLGLALGDATAATVQMLLAAGWREVSAWLKLPGRLNALVSLMDQGELATLPELTPVMRRLDRLVDLGEARFFLLLGFGLAGLAAASHYWWPCHPAIVGAGVVLALVALAQAWRLRRRAARRMEHPRPPHSGLR
ncbi:MAG: AarF/UbiB family protein [Firmicutes bacterium]|nr:AarF/UbiB family protein [Bacillota bacterium]